MNVFHEPPCPSRLLYSPPVSGHIPQVNLATKETYTVYLPVSPFRVPMLLAITPRIIVGLLFHHGDAIGLVHYICGCLVEVEDGDCSVISKSALLHLASTSGEADKLHCPHHLVALDSSGWSM